MSDGTCGATVSGDAKLYSGNRGRALVVCNRSLTGTDARIAPNEQFTCRFIYREADLFTVESKIRVTKIIIGLLHSIAILSLGRWVYDKLRCYWFFWRVRPRLTRLRNGVRLIPTNEATIEAAPKPKILEPSAAAWSST